MPSWLEWIDHHPLEAALAAAGVALVLLAGGWVAGRTGRAGRGSLGGEPERLRAKIARADTQIHDLSRTIQELRSEHNPVANLALALPHVVRDMNRKDVDPSEVPGLILRLAQAVFEPRQLLLYGQRTIPGTEGGPQRELNLVLHRGLDTVPEELRRVSIGEGKIGWVAQQELDMLRDDWNTFSRTEGLKVANNHPSLLPDIMGPLLHHGTEQQQVLGVLCIGAPRIRPRDPKLMFQMVTNFGTLALVNARNVKRLKSMANTDGLTGLLNKRAFTEDRGRQLLVQCERQASPYSIFIFDLDNFKNYNDTNGHPAGDDLLRRMGQMITELLRPGDLACRYGGEEFVIAMPDTDRESALEQAERIRAAVASASFEHMKKQPMGHISISGGVAAFPKDGQSVAELLQRADEALYDSKKSGRNRVSAHRTVEIGSGDLPLVSVDGRADDSVDLGVTRG